MIDASVVMSKTRRLEILGEYVAARSDATSAPDMRYEDHILKVMKIAVEEFASHAAGEIKRIESSHETDIATLEQEARQMRARMERLESENAALVAEVQTERCLSFRSQVEALEQRCNDLIMLCRPVMKAHAAAARLDDFETVISDTKGNASC